MKLHMAEITTAGYIGRLPREIFSSNGYLFIGKRANLQGSVKPTQEYLEHSVRDEAELTRLSIFLSNL